MGDFLELSVELRGGVLKPAFSDKSYKKALLLLDSIAFVLALANSGVLLTFTNLIKLLTTLTRLKKNN